MRVLLEPAYILHLRPYQETSLLIDCFTGSYGRNTLIARGIRTPKSKLRSILQPFTPLVISWQGKTELMTLTVAEASEIPFLLQGDCLLSAFYLNELLMRLLPKNDPYPLLYTVYQKSLMNLQKTKLDLSVLRLFEKKLLTELGYGIELQYDFVTRKPLIPDAIYRYIPERGFTLCMDTISEKSSDIFMGKNLLAFASETLNDEECLNDAKRLMRRLLSCLLGTQTIYSRKLFV
jgi:DNA repair protein RecO (recombination protein O)